MLPAADSRFGYTFDVAAIGMCLVGLDGEILRANTALAALVDRPAAELTGYPFALLTHPDDAPPFSDADTVTMSGRSDPTFWSETRFVQPSGDAVWGLVATALLLDDGSHAICRFVQVVDITAAKESEEALRKQAAMNWLLREVATAANEAATSDEALATAVTSVCAHAGWPVGHVCRRVGDDLVSTPIWHIADGMTIDAFVAETEGTVFRAGIGLPGRVMASRQAAWIVDVRHDGNFPRAGAAAAAGLQSAAAFPVMAGGEVRAVLEFFSDRPGQPDEEQLAIMTNVGAQLGRAIEREEAAAALRSSEERIRHIVDTATDAFIGMDASGTITDWNESSAAVFGWTRAQAIGHTVAGLLIPVEMRAAHREGLQRFLSTGEAKVIGQRLELNALHRDGHEFPVEITIWAAPTDVDWGFFAFARDITARKRAELVLAEAYERERLAADRLRDANGMKDEFLATVSHELRTPLTIISGFAETLRHHHDQLDGDRRDEFVDRIRSSADAMGRMVEQLLDFSRLQAGNVAFAPENVPIVESLRRTADGLGALLAAYTVVVEGPPALVAWTDPQALDRIVSNLLTNAAKFSAAGTRIEVSVRRAGDEVEVRVRDHGIGVPPGEEERIFERFVQLVTVPGHRGTGVGLAVARRYAELAGGRIWADQPPDGGGAVFAFTLPIGSRRQVRAGARGTAR
ncbi:MAG: putative Histidine kinase [Acidimicrobiales bacterium]|nr:putative Histidine kinase [Acidimicrobiales bacterium]